MPAPWNFFPRKANTTWTATATAACASAPEEAEGLRGLCPQCGKPLTYGVMHRVRDLADRPAGASPPAAKPFESLIALPEVLAEVLQVGAASKKVRQRYFRLLEVLGPELEILRRVPLEALAREGGSSPGPRPGSDAPGRGPHRRGLRRRLRQDSPLHPGGAPAAARPGRLLQPPGRRPRQPTTRRPENLPWT